MILKKHNRGLWVVLVHGLGVTEKVFFEPLKERVLFVPLRFFLDKEALALSEYLERYFNLLSWTQSFGKIEGESKKFKAIEEEITDYAIVAHSRGGLIARYAIQNYGIKPKALICLSTPHRGSALADIICGKAKIMSHLFPFIGRRVQAIEELSRDGQFVRRVNENFQKEKHVPHFDIAGFSPFPFLKYMKSLLGPLDEVVEGKGDGLVSLFSAKSPLTPSENFFTLPVNHANILVDRRVADIIKILKCITQNQV